VTKEEFATWQAITESSRNKWVEDDFFRLNGHGEFYHIGGKKFLVDLFSQEDKNEIVRAALAKLNSSPGKENAEEKGGKDSEGYTSVRKAIKENSAQPKLASKGRDAVSKEKAKGGGEL
jgi:hypothetical protein